MLQIGIFILSIIAVVTLEVSLIILLTKHFRDIKDFIKSMDKKYEKLRDKFEDINSELISIKNKQLIPSKGEEVESLDKKDSKANKILLNQQENEISDGTSQISNITKMDPVDPKELDNILKGRKKMSSNKVSVGDSKGYVNLNIEIDNNDDNMVKDKEEGNRVEIRRKNNLENSNSQKKVSVNKVSPNNNVSTIEDNNISSTKNNMSDYIINTKYKTHIITRKEVNRGYDDGEKNKNKED